LRRASYTGAKERGIFEGDQNARIDWDSGYEACVCAYVLGHDVEAMIEIELFEPSLLSTAAVVFSLLNGSWKKTLREDPRK
jgi:hypothetical protein